MNQSFEEAVGAARDIKQRYVDPTMDWYWKHTAASRYCFRAAGISTIVLSAALPALSVADFRHKTIVLTCVSITIAVLTGLSSFYHWERTWQGNRTAQVAIEQHCARWELELRNAELILPADRRVEHVYQATSNLLSNVAGVTSSESEGFFRNLQFPQADNKPRSG